MTTRILVDADACPVKEEIYKVAFRTRTPVAVIANQAIRIPKHELIERIVVGDAMDAADDWIAENADVNAVVVTADILLADRAIKKGASVIAPNGKPFTADSIGGAIATRAIMADLRAGAEMATAGGPPPFRKEDRSRFLQTLDETLTKLRRIAK
ncbi:MAG: YaiI/YqxD family protein [Pseudomonadota bacterium]